MQDTPEPPEPAQAKQKDGKADRLAEALRANLARRKAQKRARALSGPAGDHAGPADTRNQPEKR